LGDLVQHYLKDGYITIARVAPLRRIASRKISHVSGAKVSVAVPIVMSANQAIFSHLEAEWQRLLAPLPHQILTKSSCSGGGLSLGYGLWDGPKRPLFLNSPPLNRCCFAGPIPFNLHQPER